MHYLFLQYPKCSTCQKARQWLDHNQISYDDRHIVNQNPTAEELKEWIVRSTLPLKNFFNTSGILYRQMNLKSQLPLLSDGEQIALLATNGMLVKRPLIIGENIVLAGFNPDKWEQLK